MPFSKGRLPADPNVAMWQLSFPMGKDAARVLAKDPAALKAEALKRCGTWHQPIPDLLSTTPESLISGYPGENAHQSTTLIKRAREDTGGSCLPPTPPPDRNRAGDVAPRASGRERERQHSCTSLADVRATYSCTSLADVRATMPIMIHRHHAHQRMIVLRLILHDAAATPTLASLCLGMLLTRCHLSRGKGQTAPWSMLLRLHEDLPIQTCCMALAVQGAPQQAGRHVGAPLAIT